jgi:hypothetical protein
VEPKSVDLGFLFKMLHQPSDTINSVEFLPQFQITWLVAENRQFKIFTSNGGYAGQTNCI